MMAKHDINVSRMVYILEFGHEAPTGETNENTGEAIKAFKPEIKRWAGKWSLTQTQLLKLSGAGIKNAVVFFVRHEESITSDYLVRLNGEIYVIDNISYDESRTANAFDLITCHHEVTKHG